MKFYVKRCRSEEKRTMNEQNGSFKEMKKKFFNERRIQNLFKDIEKRFFTEQLFSEKTNEIDGK